MIRLTTIDIVLLSTTGHGLYLSVKMSQNESKVATLALMCSLLLSGAIGTWISIGGTYYLISMAFSAANMFVLTRLIGGLAFTLAGSLLGFVVVCRCRAKVGRGLLLLSIRTDIISHRPRSPVYLSNPRLKLLERP